MTYTWTILSDDYYRDYDMIGNNQICLGVHPSVFLGEGDLCNTVVVFIPLELYPITGACCHPEHEMSARLYIHTDFQSHFLDTPTISNDLDTFCHGHYHRCFRRSKVIPATLTSHLSWDFMQQGITCPYRLSARYEHISYWLMRQRKTVSLSKQTPAQRMFHTFKNWLSIWWHYAWWSTMYNEISQVTWWNISHNASSTCHWSTRM